MRKNQFDAYCVKEWQNKVQGKGLYDTDSEEEVEVNQGLHLIKEERSRLKDESQYLTEQIIASGGLHSDYIKARGNYPKGSYDYTVLDREKSKVDQYRKVYEHKLRDRTSEGNFYHCPGHLSTSRIP